MTKHSIMHRTACHERESSGPTVSTADAEKPCFKGNGEKKSVRRQLLSLYTLFVCHWHVNI